MGLREAGAVGGWGAHHSAEVEHFGGNGRADKLRQKIRPAVIGEQADLGKVLAEGSAVDREADVASESKVHAGAGGRPIHGSDYGLRHRSYIEHSLHTCAK